MKEINIEIFYWKILKIGYYQKWNSRLTLKCQVGTTVRLTKLEKVGTEEYFSDRKFVILVAQCLIVSSFKIIWKEDLFYIKWIIFEKIYFFGYRLLEWGKFEWEWLECGGKALKSRDLCMRCTWFGIPSSGGRPAPWCKYVISYSVPSLKRLN